MDSVSISTVGNNIGESFECTGLSNSGTIVSDIKDEVTEAMVCKYFGPKSSKSGWKYVAWTTPKQQDAMRREYRESLKRRRRENKHLKKEGEGGVLEGPTRVGKKRCVASQGGFFPESLQLTMKPEHHGGIVMGGKSGKCRLRVGPNWGKEEVESMVRVIEKSTNLMTESKVLLSASQLEMDLFEDKLRRAKILWSDREMMFDESSEEVRKYCAELSSLRNTIVKKKKILVEVEKASPSSEQCSQLRKEILSDETACERLLFQKDMEERIVSRSQKVLLSCQLEVDGCNAQLEDSVKHNAKVSHRVLAMEKLLVGMKNQLTRMQDGGGASFFPRPVFGSPLTPVVAVHILNACPLCSLWFSAYDYVSLGCGHTYHPFCLFHHSQNSSKCLLETCGEPFHLHSIAGIGIRLQVKKQNHWRRMFQAGVK